MISLAVFINRLLISNVSSKLETFEAYLLDYALIDLGISDRILFDVFFYTAFWLSFEKLKDACAQMLVRFVTLNRWLMIVRLCQTA